MEGERKIEMDDQEEESEEDVEDEEDVDNNDLEASDDGSSSDEDDESTNPDLCGSAKDPFVARWEFITLSLMNFSYRVIRLYKNGFVKCDFIPHFSNISQIINCSRSFCL